MGRGWGGLLFEGGGVGFGCVSWECGGWVVRVWVGVAVGW